MSAAALVAGQGHDQLVRVVSVLFLDYREFDFPHFHEKFHLRGDASGAVFTSLQEIHTLDAVFA